MEFGGMLRQWRTQRRYSQSRLAEESEVSTKHLSFLETGRAQPSRQMVLLLGSALDLPLRDRNVLLISAGFAPAYRERAWDDPALADVRRAMQLMLDHHAPYPAWVMDAAWNVLELNEPSRKLWSFMFPGLPLEGLNALRICFDDRLRPFMEDWEKTAALLLRQLHAEAHASGRQDLLAMLDELVETPGLPLDWRQPKVHHAMPALLPITLNLGPLRLSTFSTIAAIGTAQDVTLSERRVELHFPADAATEAFFRSL
jgi:transcriptional regulator with XRE-family HTH domain